MRSHLLGITFSVWQFCGHMEHYLFIVEVVVDWLGSCLAMCHIQATTKAAFWKKVKKKLWITSWITFQLKYASCHDIQTTLFLVLFWTTFRSNNHSRYSTINPNVRLKSKENYNVIRYVCKWDCSSTRKKVLLG